MLITWIIAALGCSAPTMHVSELVYVSDGIQQHVTEPGQITGMVPALVNAIERTEYSLDIAIYDLDLIPIARAIHRASDRGVAVRLVTDEDEADTDSIQRLIADGIPVTLRPAGDRIMHHKFAIFDDGAVWTGSTNWTESGISMNNNNVVIVQHAAIAARYFEEFEQLFAGNFGTNKVPSSDTSMVSLKSQGSVGVWFAPQDNPASELISRIEAAETSISFLIFSLTRDDVLDALIAAHDRGVKVVGVFDEWQASGAYSIDEELAAAGIPVFLDGNYEYVGLTGGRLHHKLMVIDAMGHDVVITGSMNWSDSGDAYNDENLLILEETTATEPFATEFCWVLDQATPHPDSIDPNAGLCSTPMTPVN